MAGYSITAQDINNRAGTVTRQLWDALEEARRMSLWLADSNNTDAILTAAPVSMASGDLTIIRAAMTDLGSANGLWAVAHAQKTVASTNDFFFNAKKLGGTYWTG